MQENDTNTQHARAFASDNFTMASDYFLSPKSKEYLSGTRFSSESDVKTTAENWLNVQGRDFCQAGLNKLVLRSDKCLNRFDDYVER
ncbi:hypothetical protein AVEN_248149-1 [Araneus ventricosus]|uniref:Uncharacterized protein n=1 Tax=Araneus ventricosus TaxID=182803 RepID=A0A4Y2WD83_ARAVE|nr:hypothetical protein AVEN_117279-1 [Araneus ventricosus]GBO34531.1 hypothetical protein AVEN_91364-1 [Araneus ventricosus]GBO35229.1 hypothetical protein AVEN_163906-1 [Araneus ventricosus]GBO35287.1 hypothetical protein AVEN_248149-1 [Araneus ventricosus]